MRRWVIRGWFVLTAVMVLMLIPSVALADNCSGGTILDCWGTALAATLGATAVGGAAAFYSGGNTTQQGPNDPEGGEFDPLPDLMKDVNTVNDVVNPPPPEPSVADQIWKEVKDFVRAQKEGLSDFRKDVEDVGKDMRRELAEEIAEDMMEDPKDHYKDN